MGADPKSERDQRLGIAEIFGKGSGASSRELGGRPDDRHDRHAEYPFRSRNNVCHRRETHARRYGHISQRHTGLEMDED